jgi:hypothetical protein
MSCKKDDHNSLVLISYELLCKLVVSWGSIILNLNVCMFYYKIAITPWSY